MLIGGSYNTTLNPFTLSACPLTTPTLLRPTSRLLSLFDDYHLPYRRCLAYCAATGLFSPNPELPLRSKTNKLKPGTDNAFPVIQYFFDPAFRYRCLALDPRSHGCSRHLTVGARLTLNSTSPSAAYTAALVVRLKKKKSFSPTQCCYSRARILVR